MTRRIFIERPVNEQGGYLHDHWNPHLIVSNYESERDLQRVNRFLYWGMPRTPEEPRQAEHIKLLVATNGGDHGVLLDHVNWLMPWKDYLGRVIQPVGAGYQVGGKLAWNSVGLGIETPEDLRPRIARLLGMDYVP